MRKQTKLVAVLSTAALLALGASMSSFAATGWQEENGTWVYYDKNGDTVTEKWAKSGDNWFWLNDDGEMGTDALVEYNDNYYYVDENGAMVTNKWVSIENDNYDGDGEDEPVNHWYYFGSNGKAFKTSNTSNTASFKTVNGKKYIFDSEGKMLYGWIDENGERKTDDNAWRDGLYYCGDENDGAQSNGWAFLHIKDDQWDNDDKIGYSDANTFDDEEQDRWFYFKDNGKKLVKKKGETINGKKYSFDEEGRMNAEWVNWDSTPATASQGSTDRADYSKGFRYFGNPEDGARVTKGWFQVVPGSYLDEGDYNDDSENWYYADKDGKLVAGEMKTINGKKYAFKESGAMVDGYKFIKLASDKKTIVDIVDNDVDDKTPTITGVPEAWENTIIGEQDSWKFDTTDGFKKHAFAWELSGYELYYFGSGDDGAMKTNKANMTIDGDSHSFLFNKSGSYKGAGKTGIDNKKYYQSGMLLTAEKEDKYAVVATLSKSGKIVAAVTLTTDEFLNDVMKVGNTASADGKFTELYDVASKVDEFKADGIEFNLVNTSGTVQKNKEKAKDGNDRCYKVNASGKITSVFVEK